MDVADPIVPMAENKQKNSNGLKIATAIACVVAVLGIGFGVYGMMQSLQKDSRITDLKTQVNSLNDKISLLENDDTVTISGGPYIENGYFYVPEWDLKFSIPSDLANYGYSVDYDEAHIGYSQPSIGFTAMLKSDILNGAQAAYYDNIETCAIVNVSKESSDWNLWGINGIIKDFDGYKLLIWNYSRHGSCDYNLHIDEVQEKIQGMFSRPEEI